MLSLPETCVQAAENYFACMFRELFAQESLYDESCRIWIIRFLNFLEDNGTGKRETLLPDHQPVLLYRKICEYIPGASGYGQYCGAEGEIFIIRRITITACSRRSKDRPSRVP